ncbi:hypothetical protein AAMO2058_000411600 [Amorphochlora amoebiformis]
MAARRIDRLSEGAKLTIMHRFDFFVVLEDYSRIHWKQSLHDVLTVHPGIKLFDVWVMNALIGF